MREHYEIEKELADQLRRASKQERRHLYSYLYDQLYRRVPLHPQLTRKASPAEKVQAIAGQMKFLGPFLNPDCIFMEVGPGDCALSFEVAGHVKQVYAVDVSDEISRSPTTPKNFQLTLSDGTSIPLAVGSVDVVYSNQLMEHLHPDDALDQLRNIHSALRSGGRYVCITPNRLTGPHDVSKHFDEVATGFHLKEYTITELSKLFREVGFSGVAVYIGARGIYRRFPALPLILCERMLQALPLALRKAIAHSAPFRMMLGVRLVGTK